MRDPWVIATRLCEIRMSLVAHWIRSSPLLYFYLDRMRTEELYSSRFLCLQTAGGQERLQGCVLAHVWVQALRGRLTVTVRIEVKQSTINDGEEQTKWH